MRGKLLSFFLLVILLFQGIPVSAKSRFIDKIIAETGNEIITTVKEPGVGSVGGEWAVIGLARSNVKIDRDYFDGYYRRLEEYVKACNGVLHNRKYTEYSRVVLAVTAIGKDPRNVAGYNLITPLGDFEKTVWQGINGPVWALIALDSGNYAVEVNKDAKVQATREMYVDYILDRQKADGGWSLSESTPSEIDITAMVLQALSSYRHIEKVDKAIGKALVFLQNKTEGFSGSGEATCESAAQVLTALCMLGIDCNSPEFTINGKTLLDEILSYYTGKGFRHIKSGEENQMATEQAFYSLVALERYRKGKSSLYAMTEEKNTFVEKCAMVDSALQRMIKLTERVENN